MSRIAVSAPGKIVLIGEYAVLTGAPALVMAVDRRATVTLQDLDSGVGSVCAPGLFPPAAFTFGADGQVHWQGANGEDYRLLTCAMGSLTDAEKTAFATGAAVAVELSSDEFYLPREGGRTEKLGLGSSAALTVALGWGLASLRRREPLAPADQDARLAPMIEAHNRFQDEPGSGADIAASLYGGSLEFRSGGQPGAIPASLPSRLRLRFVWAGHSASTASYLDALARWRSAHAGEYDRILARLGILAETAVKSARRGDVGEFLAVTGTYADGLQQLGDAAGMDIVSPVHRRITAAAHAAGVVYKPCGAGGGDLGVALTDDPDRLARFERNIERLEIACVPLQPDAVGVQAVTNGRI